MIMSVSLILSLDFTVAGYCSAHGEAHESAIFKLDVGGSDSAGDTSGTFNFNIPHCADHVHTGPAYQDPSYEVQYIRKNEVLGRVTAANESIAVEHTSNPRANDSDFDVVGLEHLFIFIAVIAIVSFGVTYFVRVRQQQKNETYGGLDCFSHHDDIEADESEEEGEVRLNEWHVNSSK